MKKLPSAPQLEVMPRVLHRLTDEKHPLAPVFTQLWFRCQLIPGKKFGLDELAAKMATIAQEGGSLYLGFERGWGVDAKLIVHVNEMSVIRDQTFVVTVQVSWSTGTSEASEALKAARLHTEIAQLAAFLEGNEETL